MFWIVLIRAIIGAVIGWMIGRLLNRVFDAYSRRRLERMQMRTDKAIDAAFAPILKLDQTQF